MNCALILDFGGVISQTLFETLRRTETCLGLAPGTLTWGGPFDPALFDVQDPASSYEKALSLCAGMIDA